MDKVLEENDHEDNDEFGIWFEWIGEPREYKISTM